MAYQLAPMAVQDAMTLEPVCTCLLYRERLLAALQAFRMRLAARYPYFGLIRMLEIDKRRSAKPNMLHRFACWFCGGAVQAWSDRAHLNPT